jgi:hypothetical protein
VAKFLIHLIEVQNRHLISLFNSVSENILYRDLAYFEAEFTEVFDRNFYSGFVRFRAVVVIETYL